MGQRKIGVSIRASQELNACQMGNSAQRPSAKRWQKQEVGARLLFSFSCSFIAAKRCEGRLGAGRA